MGGRTNNRKSWWPPVKVSRFYVFREDFSRADAGDLTPPVEGLHIVYLREEDAAEIHALRGEDVSVDVMRRRFERGDLCLGLRKEGELICVSWAFTGWVYFGCYRMPLKSDEVFLFDLFVKPAFRGNGIAGYARCRMWERLKRLGRNKIYSVCLRDNKPAMRFREKLQIRMVDRGVSVKIFNRWRIGTKAKPEKIRSIS